MKIRYTILLTFLLLSVLLHAASDLATSSVLASGKWYKLSATSNGIYKVTGTFLSEKGVDLSSVDPAKIRLFGNGAGMLPELNSATRQDDLREVMIKVYDGGDGKFDLNDYFIFYAESADKWVFEKQTRFFSHQKNLYSDTTYYFLNMDQQAGRRVSFYPYQTLTPTHESAVYDIPLYHELDSLNLIRSGKEWYGEVFDYTRNSLTIPFHVPHIDNTATVRLKTSVAGKAPSTSYFVIWQNGERVDSLKIDSTDPKAYTVAGRAKTKFTTLANQGPDQSVTLVYNLPTANTIGWLNYLEMTTRSHLVWEGPQMSFRDVASINPDAITRFTMTGTTGPVTVWDVTNPASILEMETHGDPGSINFIRTTDSLREFIAFDGSVYHTPGFAGEVVNQNLHAQDPATMIIVTHSLFREQADRLAGHHREANGMSVVVTDVTSVFNEFGGGQPDPTAIRDYVKMLYNKGSGANKPKYLLLFGDGSYDPKNRIPGNNNFIPTFQSAESLITTSTFVTDDYFGIMSPSMGLDASGTIDIGIGRFPLSTAEEARVMVDKIISYSGNGYPVRSDWRNVLTFIADDENQNLHLSQAEELTQIVKSKFPVFNVQKIYFDAYKMIEIPGGQRFPDATTAVNQAVEQGSLIINYTGHGGEDGLSYEKVVTTGDIESWKNADKLAVFVTATCEFSRFDNPERYTAGEMLINQPGGGAIALYSTTRLAFAGDNIGLNKSFFEHLMDRSADGQFIKMGDLIRLSKNDNKNKYQLKNFALLGDPAQSIAFPEHVVATKHINEGSASFPDTVHGLSMVTVNGQVEDILGNKLTDFNGVLQCKVFDKPVTYTTLGNRPNGETFPEPFLMQDHLLFHGSVPVTEGEFYVSFPVPRGISLQYGNARISYFAYDSTREAAGYNDRMILGGLDPSVNPANNGPEIRMYLNSSAFVNGQIVPKNSRLYADLSDTNGINWLGLGIGHEILAITDEDYPHSVMLNDYFSPVFDSWSRGNIIYDLPELSPGRHTLKLRAWDMFDNSSEKEISFTVAETDPLKVTQVITAPNPMTESTRFLFSPNADFPDDIDIVVQIFNLQGVLQTTLRATWQNPLKAGLSLTWDGTTSSGATLANGLYPYKIVFRGKDGSYYETNQKLMILR